MAFSYRYLIKSLTGVFRPIHYIAFPFIDNSCLSLGLYNFSSSLIILFFIFGFWIRYNQNMSYVQWIKFSFLLTLLYFSHFLSFVFFGIFLITFIVYDEFEKSIKYKRINWKTTLTRLSKIIIVSIPGLFFALIYVLNINTFAYNPSADQPETISLLQNFYYVRPLIFFHIENDGSRNMILFFGIVIIFIVVLLQSVFRRKELTENKFNRTYLLILTIIFFILILLLPPRFLLNTMRIRLSLMFFILFSIWLSLYHFPKWFHLLAALFFLGIVIYNKLSYRETYENMDRYSSKILEFNNWIEPNSIVLPIYNSYSWTSNYSMSYLGIDKPIVQLRAAQAFGFFPVIYKTKENLPLTLLGSNTPNEIGQMYNSGFDTTKTTVIDYVVIANSQAFLRNTEKNEVFLNALSRYYTNIVASADSNFVLYKLSNKFDTQRE